MTKNTKSLRWVQIFISRIHRDAPSPLEAIPFTPLLPWDLDLHIQFDLPCSAADTMTSALETNNPPFRPNFSATTPVIRPPIIPPKQNIDTAMAHIRVTCDLSTDAPLFLFDITPRIHSSINCKHTHTRFQKKKNVIFRSNKKIVVAGGELIIPISLRRKFKWLQKIYREKFLIRSTVPSSFCKQIPAQDINIYLYIYIWI